MSPNFMPPSYNECGAFVDSGSPATRRQKKQPQWETALAQSEHGGEARQKGFEPLTHGLEGRCSIRLSYWRIPLKWSG
jgi:hypothetical protein